MILNIIHVREIRLCVNFDIDRYILLYYNKTISQTGVSGIIWEIPVYFHFLYLFWYNNKVHKKYF